MKNIMRISVGFAVIAAQHLIATLKMRAMRAVLLLTVAGAWSISAHAQSLGASLAAAHNDKSQKAYGPYKRAFTEKLGEEFRKAHGPYEERRLLCKWDAEWVECGYLKLSHASSLTAEQRQTIMEVMLSPCAHISFEILNAPKPKYADLKASFEEYKAYAAWEKQKHLLISCQAGMFDATAVRVAEPHRDEKGKSAPDMSKDEIGFEARIRVTVKSNQQGGKNEPMDDWNPC